MPKPFKDPIEVKTKKDGVYPWGFNAPSYDNRTSCSIPAGNDYGIGHRTPMGSMQVSGMKGGPIPQESKCFSPDEIFHGEDKKG
jgi:hypothetical protein